MAQTRNQPNKPQPMSHVSFYRIIALVSILIIIIALFIIKVAFHQTTQQTTEFATKDLIATVTASAVNPVPYGGTLVFADSLRDNTNKTFGWDTNDNCHFADGAYVVTPPISCFTKVTLSDNFAFQTTMRIKSTGCGEILFKENDPSDYSTYTYKFDVCTDGSYTFDFSGQNDVNLAQGSSSDILKGVNQPNVIAVVTNYCDVDLYVNYQDISHFSAGCDQNRMYSVEGVPGVSSDFSLNSSISNPPPLPDVMLNDTKVWKLATIQLTPS